MSKTIFETITEAHFVATAAQVEMLASIVANGSYSNGTYLRVLIAHTLQDIGPIRKVTKQAVLAVLEGVHERLYASVMKGVGDEAVALPERHRRATFARTAASTLRRYVVRNGDIRKIDIDTVTKGKLRDFGMRVPTGTRVQRSMQRASGALMRAVRIMARTSPADARKRLMTMRAEIDLQLAKLRKASKHNGVPAAARGLVVRRPARGTEVRLTH